VDEGDEAVCSPLRSAVDKFEARRLEASKLRLDVWGTEGNVMEARPMALEEASYGRIGAQWLEKFNGSDEGDANTLAFHDLGRGTAFTRQEFEEAAALFDGGDGDRHVVEWKIRF